MPRPEHLLDLAVRRRLFQLVQTYPGLHEREAARQLGTSQALVNHHRHILEESGLLTSERGDGILRMYVVPATGVMRPSAEEKDLLTILRNRKALHIVLVMLQSADPVSNGELSSATGLSKSHVSFYVAKLVDRGVVEKTAEGLFRLPHARRIQQVLTRYKPTPDLIEEFEDLWTGLYGV